MRENGGDGVVGLNLSNFYINNSIWQYACKLPALQLLDLSHNLIINSVSECAGSFANLTILRLSSNYFSGSIPPQLSSLSNLRDLDLNGNRLAGLVPSQLFSLSNLQTMDLSGNLLTGFTPLQLHSSSNLRTLNLNGNRLTELIPSQLFSLSNLQTMDLSGNLLTGFTPLQLHSSSNLRTLNLNGNRLTELIPSQLFSLSNLQTMDLSNNKLTGFTPLQLYSLSSLRVLDLNTNELTGFIPPQLFSLSKLEDVDLSFNHFSGEIPQNFSRNLFSLRMENNSLTGVIPSPISNARNLRYLVMNNNFLKGPIPEQLASCTQLQRLHADNNKLGGPLNHVLPKLPQLTYLSLSNNMIDGSITDELSNLSNLTHMDLSGNLLSGNISPKIFNLKQLRILYLQKNYLQGFGIFPLNIQNGKSLENIRLDRNNLTGRIPSEIGKLDMFYGTLDLSHNSLTGEFPITLCNLRFIRSLDLSNNKLTGEIPEALEKMTQLSLLDLSNNKLTGKIPGSLRNMHQLNSLNLSNNKLTVKNPESLKQIPFLDLSNNELVDGIPTGKSHSTFLIKVLGVVGVVAIFIICCLILGVVWIRNLHNRAEFKRTIRKILQKVEHPRISYEELLAATNRFHNSNLLSTNSFGSVYKGFLPDGTRVAVKVLNLMHEQSHKIFRAECKVLQKARHRNLARIITTCSTIRIKALIFEYFANGSLEKHLYLESFRLEPRKLLNIAIDIAHALEYLHYDCFVQIVHCDIKPSNVLLDESMTAHLSDFGISRLTGRITANSVTSTIDLKGSVGYIAPEYGLSGMMSPRGDVYSYGILLLEMLTRRRPTDNMFDGDLNLHSWVKRAFPDRAFEVVDKSLLMEGASKETEECLTSLMRLGLMCSSDSPEARPTMRDVSNQALLLPPN